MKKNRIVALMLSALVLSASLTACGGGDSNANTSGSGQTGSGLNDIVMGATKTPSASADAATTAADTGATDATSAASSADTAQEAQTGASTEASPSGDTPDYLGTKTERSYYNPAFDLKLVLPDNWNIMSQEEVASLMQLGAQALDNEDISELLESGVAYYDLYANNPATSDNINITIQEMSAAEAAMMGSGAFSIENYLELISTQLEMTYDQAGATEVKTEVTTTTFRGEDTPCIKVNVTLMGINMEQICIVLTEGSYVAVMTATAGGFGDSAQDMINWFTRG